MVHEAILYMGVHSNCWGNLRREGPKELLQSRGGVCLEDFNFSN